MIIGDVSVEYPQDVMEYTRYAPKKKRALMVCDRYFQSELFRSFNY